MIVLSLIRNGWRDYSSADHANQKILVCNNFHGMFLALYDKKSKLRISFVDACSVGRRISSSK